MSNDICKCQGTNCPIKSSCKRFICVADKWQSWFVEMPCEWYENCFYCQYYLNTKK